MPLDEPLISVIVPVHNSRVVLETCLNSIIAAMACFGKAELILIDNGSIDGSYELLRERYATHAKALQQKGGTIASLRNRGAEMANGEYLCFIDSDCAILPTHFQKALEVFKATNPDATGCKCGVPSSPSWVEETWQKLHARTRDGFVNYLNSGNFIIKREAFRKIGGFDGNLVTDEDADLGLRLRTAGFKIYESHSLGAIHLRNPKRLIDFFRKEAWRGSSLLRSAQGRQLDKVLLMAEVHLFLVALGIAGLWIVPAPLALRIGLLVVLTLAVPLAAVVYRFIQLGRLFNPLRSALLYHLWFDAKAYAVLLRAASLLSRRK